MNVNHASNSVKEIDMAIGAIGSYICLDGGQDPTVILGLLGADLPVRGRQHLIYASRPHRT